MGKIESMPKTYKSISDAMTLSIQNNFAKIVEVMASLFKQTMIG